MNATVREIRVCGYCTGKVVHHDDVFPYRCTVCDRLLKESETAADVLRVDP